MSGVAVTNSLVSGSTESRRELVSLLRGGTAMLVASMFGNGIGYLFSLFLARMLGAADFGLYALGLTIYNVVTLVMLAGLDSGVVKFISESLSRENPRAARRVLMQALVVAAFLGLCASLGLALAGGPMAGALYNKSGLAPVVTLFALAVPISMISTILVSALIGSRSIMSVALIRNVWEPIAKFALAGLLLWYGLGLNGIVTAVVLTSVGSVILAVRWLRGARWCADPAPWSSEGVRSLMSFWAPMILTTLFGVVAPRSDILFLGYWTSAEDIGVYQAAFQTAAVLVLVAAAFDITFAPLAAGTAARGDHRSLAEAYQLVSRWTFTISIPIVWMFVAAGKEIMSLFGPAFEGGQMCLTLLALGQLVNTCTTYAHSVLLMSGQTIKIMWNTILTSGLMIVANWLLIPRYGIVGAAVAVGLSLTAGGLLRLAQVWYLKDLHPFSWNLLKPLGAGVGATGVGYAATEVLGNLPLSGSAALVGLVYVGLLLLLRVEAIDRLMLASLVERTRCWKAT